MALLVSTNMFHTAEIKNILETVRPFPGVGAEIFAYFHDPLFSAMLEGAEKELRKIPISFHEPCYHAEHSDEPGSSGYARTMAMLSEAAEWCEKLKARHMVYHHNNCRILPEEKERRIQHSCENYLRTEKLFHPLGIELLVENAGTEAEGTALFDQEEFIRLCQRESYPVLLDIGRAHVNGWDLPRVMKILRGQIRAYHLHNNDGIRDSHRRIHDGTLDFEAFLAAWRENAVETDWILEYSREVAADEEGIREDLAYLTDACRL